MRNAVSIASALWRPDIDFDYVLDENIINVLPDDRTINIEYDREINILADDRIINVG